MAKELHEILEKVSNLYRKYGIKSVTMDDISGELGISKKTLYLYVRDKKELVEKVILYEHEKKGISFRDIYMKEQNAIEELLEVNRLVTKLMQDYNPSLEYDLRKYYPKLNKRIKDDDRQRMYIAILKNMESGKEEGLFRKDLNTEVIAKLQISRFENFQDSELFSRHEAVSFEVFREIFIYHIRGISNEKGIKYLERRLKEMDINK